MPIQYLRRLTSPERTDEANRRLGQSLAFVAGAANAGGFLAVKQYTSHMSGIVSAVADDLVLGDFALVLAGLASLLAFLGGAACTAVLVNWGRRRSTQSAFALPLLLEAALLLGFGLMGASLSQYRVVFVPVTVALLCFMMGLQNAIITKISRAEIRTTHVTGLTTDIGIEIGKALYWNRGHRHLHAVVADRPKLRLLSSLLGMFFLGGVTGAMGFKHIGYVATIPLASILMALAVVPVMDDLVARRP
ncbi:MULTISPECIES: YoaK family protein [Ralstonia solanacearum species complex]|uniref:DUF1275 domain-containing protein n=1 Tax=Ralstonia syzygii TaxID=28097 RepID=A0ABX7ZL96_9RALS|nr:MULTISPECIES: YoaK family protein [Ralstonia solanacearum species complex]BEU73927.1 YoaK family protein [Ralstonia pseudosolanacearum]AMP39458.1 hypothetical protein LBM2029_17755 [Ralstonia solanacearum]AXV78844.1 DUF1275 domain-containing protein [Ralstonia solanacearum]AXV88293.1 DUF1275 domain-containing protein [Ralstonia solanacearum]AXV92866.1 DUF1275 domain-containing protein [Ralstonia solanacearum]